MAPILTPVKALYSLLYFLGLETSSPALSPPPKALNETSSEFIPKCHPRVEEVSAEVNGYFLQHWPFENEKARKRFVAAGFSTVTCFYFPAAKDDRIHFACRLLTLLFLIDDILEDMSLDEGSKYNENLIPISRGDVLPNRDIPVEWITYDLWESMRAYDKPLADEILEPVFTFMRAQTDKLRLTIQGLGPYLEYRERDVGKALLCALMRFSMGLHLTPAQLDSVKGVEQNCAKHLSIMNDVYSWDKELRASKIGHAEGAAICSAVQVLNQETDLPYEAAKKVLLVMCRGWETKHAVLVNELPDEWEVQTYAKGLEYQISGNERWSQTTLRYHSVD
ncbi:Aristolochene synthase in complex with 12-13 Difluorofarnesyl diphosphate [Penicillium soppii]|uniref:Aristolochene synthase in complex with 12-13 Difluorofarnesyl diphosphate n=1 Tax=Penicillium soppii TaxID=69789 RepID=UPI002547763C|nr:Aristolochene synthase in complex with 12-13 Difluorofarnesyl diphosphate [Penicillium soppii]KAJ5874092.1 Aristolochene synthase in complex with 12-13 Difluorofarnesyl diphosphate [Penicillium soppii]